VSPRLSVHLTPPRAPLPARSAAVVIDVLRATSTLTVALAQGARRVLPASSAEEARALRARYPAALLCGERGAVRIPGFDLGNSPYEYGAARVGGRDLVFASTNGALALVAARHARRRLLAAFINVSAVVEALAGEEEVAVVCSGRLGGFSLEDAACAGWIARALVRRGARPEGAAARAAVSLAPPDAAGVRALVEGSAQGRTLRGLGGGWVRDLDFCAGLDRLDRAFEV
jgi:2-phosphosulfolactate phosphatase